jgi:hypothetical protein
VLRGGTNVVDAYYDPGTGNLSNSSESNYTTIVADFDDGTIANNTLALYGSSATPTSLECGLAGGDSGGGVFANIAGSTVLIGINDFNGPGNFGSNTQYGAILGATRVSSYASWIDSEVPEPGSAGLAAGAVAGLLAGARRLRISGLKVRRRAGAG